MDTFFEFRVTAAPGIRVEVYTAKVVGRHPEYVYARKFCHLTRRKTNGGYWYIADIENYGIYEISIKRFEDKPGGEFLGRTRRWFISYDGEFYDLDSWNVMVAFLWLKDYLRGKDGGAA